MPGKVPIQRMASASPKALIRCPVTVASSVTAPSADRRAGLRDRASTVTSSSVTSLSGYPMLSGLEKTVSLLPGRVPIHKSGSHADRATPAINR